MNNYKYFCTTCVRLIRDKKHYFQKDVVLPNKEIIRIKYCKSCKGAICKFKDLHIAKLKQLFFFLRKEEREEIRRRLNVEERKFYTVKAKLLSDHFIYFSLYFWELVNDNNSNSR